MTEVFLQDLQHAEEITAAAFGQRSWSSASESGGQGR
jgi:hypothetical protein